MGTVGDNTKYLLLHNEEYKTKFVGSFQDLRTSGEFLDVTLACGDETIEAHKVVLSAFSPFFRHVLNKSKQPHPYIYLKGILYTDLLAIVNYLYNGEAQIPADDVNRFIEAATELQICDLMSEEADDEETSDESSEFTFSPEVHDRKSKAIITYENNDKKEGSKDKSQNGSRKKKSQVKQPEDDENFLVKQEAIESSQADESLPVMDELDASGRSNSSLNESEDKTDCTDEKEMKQKLLDAINQKLEKVETENEGKVWQCTDCGKVSKNKLKLGLHVETHLEGFSHNCKFCNRTYKTRGSLQMHTSTSHRGQKLNE